MARFALAAITRQCAANASALNTQKNIPQKEERRSRSHENHAPKKKMKKKKVKKEEESRGEPKAPSSVDNRSLRCYCVVLPTYRSQEEG